MVFSCEIRDGTEIERRMFNEGEEFQKFLYNEIEEFVRIYMIMNFSEFDEEFIGGESESAKDIYNDFITKGPSEESFYILKEVLYIGDSITDSKLMKKIILDMIRLCVLIYISDKKTYLEHKDRFEDQTPA